LRSRKIVEFEVWFGVVKHCMGKHTVFGCEPRKVIELRFNRWNSFQNWWFQWLAL
jgi:hypothetical protein